MPKTTQLDILLQQIDTLSLAELLVVQARINELIEEQDTTSWYRSPNMGSVLPSKNPITSVTTRNHYWWATAVVQQAAQLESKAKADDSLAQVIELVEEWMEDESGYDQETYPDIEAALNKNEISM